MEGLKIIAVIIAIPIIIAVIYFSITIIKSGVDKWENKTTGIEGWIVAIIIFIIILFGLKICSNGNSFEPRHTNNIYYNDKKYA